LGGNVRPMAGRAVRPIFVGMSIRLGRETASTFPCARQPWARQPGMSVALLKVAPCTRRRWLTEPAPSLRRAYLTVKWRRSLAFRSEPSEIGGPGDDVYLVLTRGTSRRARDATGSRSTNALMRTSLAFTSAMVAWSVAQRTYTS